MTTTIPGYEKRVPDYWLAVAPALDADAIPHPLSGLFPNYLVPAGIPLGGTPTDVKAGSPGFFYPLGSNEDDLAALKANGDIGDGQLVDWDTKGQYVVLGDGSEAHYRIDAWWAGRVP